MVTKRYALKVFGSQVALADALDISKSAVSQWAMDKPLPELRQWQLHSLRPADFPLPVKGKAA